MTTPNPVDVRVGMRIRQRRLELRMSQTVLADHLGLTFQQVQKYERGANRTSASMLHAIAGKLEKPVGWFFEDVGGHGETAATSAGDDLRDLIFTQGGDRLARAFVLVAAQDRAALVTLAESLAGQRRRSPQWTGEPAAAAERAAERAA